MKKFKFIWVIYLMIAVILTIILGNYFNIFDTLSTILFYMLGISIVALFITGVYYTIKSIRKK